MTYKKDNCAEFQPVNVFQFKSDLVKPISCIRIKVIIMLSILAIMRGIYRKQVKCNYLKNQKFFVDILLHFWNVHKILSILEKNLTLVA